MTTNFGGKNAGWSSYSEKDQMQIYKNSALNQIMAIKVVPMKQFPIGAKDYAEMTSQMIKKNCSDPKVDGDDKQAVIRCLHNGHESATYVFEEENYGLTICSTMNGVSEATVKEILAEHKGQFASFFDLTDRNSRKVGQLKLKCACLFII